MPITGQTFAVLLAGALLGSRRGTLAVGVYLHYRLITRRRSPNVCAVLVIVAMVLIVLTLAWANFDRRFAGLHSCAR